MSLAYQIRGMTGAAPEVHLNGTIGTGDSSFAFAPGEGTGWPTANIPAIIDYDNGFAEKVLIGTRSGVNCTGVLRGEDNTTATSHSSGAKIRHVGFAQDFVEANAVAAALTTKGDSLWKGGTLSVAPARLAAGSDQQIVRYKAANALGVETTHLGSIPVFASTAARDTAIPSPSSGQACYIDTGASTEGLYFYNGTSWRPVAWNAPWGVIAAITDITASQGSISAVADVTNSTLAFTAVTGRRYKFTAQTLMQQITSTGTAEILLTDNSNNQKQDVGATLTASSFLSINLTWLTTITAGSVSYKLRAKTSAGTLTITASATQPTQFWVEDVGPSGNPT